MRWEIFFLLFLAFFFVLALIFLPSLGFRITCFKWKLKGSSSKKSKNETEVDDYGFRLK
ncbi:MAG: hypothetical protein AB1410_03370 [Acidobacteriota bacterium]